jgi:non-ribosomal peptide synthetase component E (peptide arylation enzyme)
MVKASSMESSRSDQRAVPRELRERYLQDGLWSASQTVATLLAEAVAVRADQLAVVDTHGGALTYAELDDRSRRVAGALRRRGIAEGDVVSVQLPNRVEASVVVCALARIGGIINTMVPVYRDAELSFMTDHCRAKGLIVPGHYRGFDHDEMAQRVAGSVDGLDVLVSLSDEPPHGIESLASLMAEEPGEDASTLTPDMVTAVLFTSGTESRPKAVLHSHNSLLANLRSLVRLLDLDERDNVFMASPVGHGTGYGFGILLALFLGSRLVLQDGWEPTEAARLISEHECGYTHGATPFVQELSDVPGITPSAFTRFRWFVTGGAAVAPGMVGRVRDRLGCTLLRLYGQTEGFMTTINRPEDPPEILETTDGKPSPGVEVEIRDEHGQALPAGEPGEAWIRGPHRCLGFMNDPAKTIEGIDDEGWLATGDLCILDARSSLTVVGRKKEVINRGGYKFSPREIEDVLSAHPKVQRIAVVKMTDERLGEKACAFVVSRASESLVLDELTAMLEEHGIAKYKWPERLELVEELPMTASGKVQKFKLETRLSEEVE